METDRLYQHGTLAMLVPGLFAGTQTIEALLQHGDTGIGTLTGLDGELIIQAGKVYQVNAQGTFREVAADEKVPFANVHYQADVSAGKLQGLDLTGFQKAVLDRLQTSNLFAAVRVEGTFTQMHTRAVLPQQPPYPTLTETASGQKEFHADNVKGTLIGYFSPDLYAGVVSPGFHLHFLSADHHMGGHILGFELDSGELFLQKFSDFQLHLPTDDEPFLKQHFDTASLVDDIRKAEN